MRNHKFQRLPDHVVRVLPIIAILVVSSWFPKALGRVHAQENTPDRAVLASLPPVGQRVELSVPYQPSTVQGLRIYPEDPLKFDFILNLGESSLSEDQLRTESVKLIKYFLASLTIPANDMWVNLSPYESERIIPEAFGYTQMGRDLLMQDYVLKQMTASLIYPEGDTGSRFWEKVHARAYARFGKIDIPVDTFNKVWVTPDKAVVYEDTRMAFVVESRLKVMLEADYLAMRHNVVVDQDETDTLTTQYLKEIVIPALEHEVNHGKHFACLRQMYQSMILAN